MFVGAMRAAAVPGSWYPGDEQMLCRAVDEHLASVEDAPRGDVAGFVAPHAGLVYSGAVAAYAYQAVAGRAYDVVVLVGLSHHVEFEGVAIYPRGWFDTPLGDVPVSTDIADRLLARPCVRTHPTAHVGEHSLEMQLPFLQRVLPSVPVVPLLLGAHKREVILAFGDALAEALADVTPLIAASTDLSHYLPACQAEIRDRIVSDHVARFDAEGLLAEYERYPADRRGRCVACGGVLWWQSCGPSLGWVRRRPGCCDTLIPVTYQERKAPWWGIWQRRSVGLSERLALVARLRAEVDSELSVRAC